MMNKMMKKVAIVLAAATVAMTAANTANVFACDEGYSVEASYERTSGNKVITASSAYIRTQPGTYGDIVKEYEHGTVIRVDGITDNGWYFFGMENPMGGIMTGYIRADLVADTNRETTPIILDEDNRNQNKDCGLEEGETYTTHVNSGYLALRNNYVYDDSNEIAPLWNGSTVIVIGPQVGDFVPVTVTYTASGEYGDNVDGRCGYVNAHYLQ